MYDDCVCFDLCLRTLVRVFRFYFLVFEFVFGIVVCCCACFLCECGLELFSFCLCVFSSVFFGGLFLFVLGLFCIRACYFCLLDVCVFLWI